jgi:CHAT domain-containing protein/Tfp pilus assembly protein PilF
MTALLLLLCSAACAPAHRAPLASVPPQEQQKPTQEKERQSEEAFKAFAQAREFQKQGLHVEAVKHLEQALHGLQEFYESMHPKVLECLTLLARAYTLKGAPAQAEQLLLRVLASQEEVHGQTHPIVASALDELATLYLEQGRFAQAQPLYERALAIRRETLSQDHPAIATSLHNLGVLSRNQGRYAQAESLTRLALAFREKNLGRYHPTVIESLQSLATLHSLQGQAARAEPLLQRALALEESLLGQDHPNVARSLHQLGLLSVAQGRPGQAEPLFQRALSIREAALGPYHADVATSLHALAHFVQSQGDASRARPLYERALSIREVALGPYHPDVATSLHALASLLQSAGDASRARPLYERALSIREAALGPRHPDVATSLHELARLSHSQGESMRAEPLYERALLLREAALGLHHPDLIPLLKDLARLRLTRQNLAGALLLLERAATASEKNLRQELFGASEARLASLLHLLREEEESLYALASNHPDNERLRKLALSTALLRKGRSLEELANTSRVIYRGMKPLDGEAFQRLRDLRAQLVTQAFSDASPPASPNDSPYLQELTAQADVLEIELAKRSMPLRALHTLPSPAELPGRVAAALPRNGALIDFVAYTKPSAPASQSAGGLHYLALLLLANGQTRAVDLGPAGPIDSAVQDLHKAYANKHTAFQPAAEKLYGLAFAPLVPHLAHVERLFLAPEGQLALVPFAALHDGQRFLIDSLDITYLTSGKDLLPRPEDSAPTRSVVILGDPAFDTAPSEPPPVADLRSASLERFFSEIHARFAGQSWLPLPETRKEAEAIQRLLPQATLLLGPDATKKALLKLSTPGILHIATHGFFLEEGSRLKGTRGVKKVGMPGGPPPRPREPLLRSGLVLAGARPLSGAPRPEDSLVTALELAGLDLWGTQLVVLSACETGRGDIRLGQGVYGLRRALVVAGAQTLVTSLWKVNDETTRQLMEDYYRHLLAGQGRTAALREAMLALRQKQPHPYFWAPFIAIGRDSPLKGFTLR